MLTSFPSVVPACQAAVLFKDPNSLGVQLVQKAALGGANLSLEEVQASLERAMKSKLTRQNPPPNDIRPNGKFFAVLRKAQQLQKAQKDSHCAVDHLLIALFDDSDVSNALASVGLTRGKLEDAVKTVRGTRKITNPNAEATVSGETSAAQVGVTQPM